MKIKKDSLAVAMVTMIVLTNTAAAGGLGGLLGAATASNPLDAIENSVINSLEQNVANSLLTGSIGSQLSPVDQNYRVQQLNGALQSGNINQAQQWQNPQTGSTIAVNPIGQATIHPQTQQQCQNLQETATLPNGQVITENRIACQDPQSGQWKLQ